MRPPFAITQKGNSPLEAGCDRSNSASQEETETEGVQSGRIYSRRCREVLRDSGVRRTDPENKACQVPEKAECN